MWAPWPNLRQTLLLHAALDVGDSAVAAWQRFGGDGALSTIDAGAYRLLPLAYRNLAQEGRDEVDVRRLRDVFKHTWYRNQLTLSGGARALAALTSAGVETMVLKGAALATGYYDDLGARPMQDFDVLVPFATARRAIHALRDAGWTPREPDPASTLLRHHATPFHGPDGCELDLHWNLQWEAVEDRAVWRAAEPIEIFGIPSRRLCPADQLLHVCVHGASSNVISPIRWIADGVMILRRQGEQLDWDRVVAQASGRRLTLTTHTALRFLRDAFGVPVADDVLSALERVPTSLMERWAHRARMSPRMPGRKLPIVWERYAKLAGSDAEPAGPVGLVIFLQRLWELERLRDVPPEVLRRTLQHGFSSER